MPRVDAAGRAMTKTVGGHWLMLDDKAAVDNVRDRLDRLAASAASRLARRWPSRRA